MRNVVMQENHKDFINTEDENKITNEMFRRSANTKRQILNIIKGNVIIFWPEK